MSQTKKRLPGLGSSISETMTAEAIIQTGSFPADKAGRFMVDLKEIRATNLSLAGRYKAGNALTWRMMESKREKGGKRGQASYFDRCEQCQVGEQVFAIKKRAEAITNLFYGGKTAPPSLNSQTAEKNPFWADKL
ncbi:Uncharacterized protein DAT39_005612 [Clarias magur]|uniref:Uncharacterized protein n=1 Tax=Clarias magur TaxID=1594786 RepID=A0A8J4ULW0_CLAMG|nr:Uncharacterized protein DAT39_005612 [Clarias magur]